MSAPSYFEPEPAGAPAYFEPEAAETPAAKRAPVDIGAGAVFGAHTARHLSFGLGDKVIAGLQAVDDLAHRDRAGGVGLLHPFDTARAVLNAAGHAVTLGDSGLSDAYRRDLAQNDKLLESADQLHPEARWAGNAAGVAGSMTLPAGALRLLRGAPAAIAATPAAARTMGQLVRAGTATGAKQGLAMGAASGFGNSRARDLTGTLEDTAAGAGTGLVGGAALGAAAPWLADKAKNAAGWLKVNSLHPTPTLGETMEEMPGGRVGVGLELLKRNIGGLTKHGTAQQLERATKGASSAIDAVVAAHDAAGGAPVNLVEPIEASLEHARELGSDPTTRAAGEKLADVAGEYRDTYGAPATAREALRLKRTLGKSAYSQSKHFAQSGEPVAGEYGKGLSKLERGVDEAMDSTLGPSFGQRNLEFRRLLSAKEAAERSAARSHSNHVLGLIPMMLGAGGYAAHGAEGGAGMALGGLLLGKYGSQAGARLLYSPVAGALESPAVSDSALATRALIEALRRRNSAPEDATP